MMMLYGLLGELGVSTRLRVAASLLPLLAPMVLFQGSTVTNDVTAIPSAAAVLWIAFRYDRGRATQFALLAVAVIAVWLRASNIFGVGIAGAFLLIRAASDPTNRRRLVHGGAILVGAAAIASAAWVVIIGELAQVPADTFAPRSMFPQGFRWGDVWDSIAPILPPTQGLPNVSLWNARPFIRFEVALLGWLLISGPLIAVMRPPTPAGNVATGDDKRSWPGSAIGLSTAIVALLVAPALIAINAVSADSYLGLPLAARLAMSLLPGFIVCLTIAIRHPWAERALVALVVVVLVYDLAILA